ncbi:MAG: hypothetical protein ABIJ08_06385 [Nanoarchaeota archaeon]
MSDLIPKCNLEIHIGAALIMEGSRVPAEAMATFFGYGAAADFSQDYNAMKRDNGGLSPTLLNPSRNGPAYAELSDIIISGQAIGHYLTYSHQDKWTKQDEDYVSKAVEQARAGKEIPLKGNGRFYATKGILIHMVSDMVDYMMIVDGLADLPAKGKKKKSGKK